MDHLVCIRAAENEKGIILPDKPDWPGLRGQVCANSGKPNKIFFVNVLYGLLAKFGCEVDHNYPYAENTFSIEANNPFLLYKESSDKYLSELIPFKGTPPMPCAAKF